MRVIFLFCLLAVLLIGGYLMIPAEKMRSRAKETIQQVQSLNGSVDVSGITDRFGAILNNEENLGEEEAVDTTNETPNMPTEETNETEPEGTPQQDEVITE